MRGSWTLPVSGVGAGTASRAGLCGLVAVRPEGRSSFYSLARPELIDLLRAAEGLLAATGHRVALCPAYGTEK